MKLPVAFIIKYDFREDLLIMQFYNFKILLFCIYLLTNNTWMLLITVYFLSTLIPIMNLAISCGPDVNNQIFNKSSNW